MELYFHFFYTKQQAYIQTPTQTPLKYGFKKRETMFQDHSGIKRLHFHNIYTRGQYLHIYRISAMRVRFFLLYMKEVTVIIHQ